MKKLFYKKIGLLMAGLLFLSGCTAGSSESNDKQKNASQTATVLSDVFEQNNEGFPLVKDKITLEFFAPQNPWIEDFNTNEFTRWYEEKTNVHIKWDVVPSDAMNEQRKLVLASENYPDVFFGAYIPPEEEMFYGPQGVLISLNSLIDKYGNYTKKMLEQVDYIEDAITMADGNIYSLPQVNECYHCMYSQKMWINTKWLKNLGLNMPKTTEDFYNVLKAFKEADPNQNGKNDEIPLTGGINGWHSEVYSFIINAFIYFDGYSHFRMLNGSFNPIVDKPEFAKALAYLNKLYKEELIDIGAFTQNVNQMGSLTTNPDVELTGCIPAGNHSVFLDFSDPELKKRSKDYEPLAPLKGSDGVQLSAYYPYSYNSGTYAITSECKYPDVAFQWADWLYSEEAALRYVGYGQENVGWRIAKPGEKDVRGRQAKWAEIPLDSEDGMQNAHFSQTGPSYRSMEFRESWMVPQDEYSSEGRELRLYNATKLYEPYKPEEIIPVLHFTAKQAEEVGQIRDPLESFIKESIARFITGDLSLEKDWEDYIKNLNSMGLYRLMEIQQSQYELEYKK